MTEDGQGQAELSFEPPLRLCGGMLSGNGEGSFRGKMYSETVERITGESLYGDLTNESVRRMARKLEDAATRIGDEEDVCRVQDLARMFRAHADAGHRLDAFF